MGDFCDRAGWYYQQIIKLYAGRCIPELLENYVVLDSDVYILKPLSFMNNGVPLFATGIEHHPPYFEHMNRLHPSLNKQLNASGICHHMVFTKTYLEELFKLVEDYSSNQTLCPKDNTCCSVENGERTTVLRPFWKIFLEELSHPIPETGASEYEIYFNFMVHYHYPNMHIRNLYWMDCGSLSDAQPHHDYIAVHHWRR
jgi:hypothetical protein